MIDFMVICSILLFFLEKKENERITTKHIDNSI